MDTINKKRLKFLNETIKHFNSTNRAMTPFGRCLYVPIEGVSEGCAIGRHIKNKALCFKLDGIGGVGKFEVFVVLPKKLKDLGQDFLAEVQRLHDNKSNWDENGLTHYGNTKVEIIKTDFNL